MTIEDGVKNSIIKDLDKAKSILGGEQDTTTYNFDGINKEDLTPEWFHEKAKAYTELEEKAKNARQDFIEQFSPAKLNEMSNEEILNKIFLNGNKHNLCYTMEYDSDNKSLFGSIAGGNSYKYDLFYSQEWKTGNKYHPVILTVEQATEKARDIVKNLLESIHIIDENLSNINNADDYESLSQKLNQIIDINKVWVLKYYQMIYPNLLPTFYSDKWINDILDLLNMPKHNNKFTNLGQIALFIRKCDVDNTVFAKICYDFMSNSREVGLEKDLDNNQIEDINELSTMKYLPKREPKQNKDSLNFILYGAPGTGKTYSTAEYALSILENRPVDLSRKTQEARKQLMQNYNNYIKQGRIVFTTFHQNYSYEDFIQGLRPVSENGLFSFKPIDGVFKKISDKAMYDNNQPYVIIIDEINRANISKVFGELITLIEDDKRWGEINEMSVTLPSGDIFAIPNNLYIIGTMNSADKSISLIDAALRRRFKFIEQHPDSSLITDATLKNVFESLNKILAEELDSTDLLIGHSYFINRAQADLCEILNNNIIPLLYEYFYDNKKKVANVLSKVLEGLSIDVCDNKISRLYAKEVENDSESL